jgi:hypothetical protein
MGNTAIMADNGNNKLFVLAAGAAGGTTGATGAAGAAIAAGCGIKAGCGLGCGLKPGLGCGRNCGATGGGAEAATGRDGATVLSPPSSKRRSRPRSNPTNFDFTMFDMADYAIPVLFVINKTTFELARILPLLEKMPGLGMKLFPEGGLRRMECSIIGRCCSVFDKRLPAVEK